MARSKKWTEKDIRALEGKGIKNKGLEGYVPSKPAGIEHVKVILERYQEPYIEEFKFSKKRRFRFDFYIPRLKTGVEYEGMGRGDDKSQFGGHQSIKGYSSDCEKYNLAQLEGHKVLRYTALNFENFEKDFKELLDQI